MIFTSKLSTGNLGYEPMADKMVSPAKIQPGFAGIDSIRDAQGNGITVSYWKNENSIQEWKGNIDHIAAQSEGRERWYDEYEVKVTKIERAYQHKSRVKK